MDDLGMLDAEPKLLLLTLFKLCYVRALQLQANLESIDSEPVSQISYRMNVDLESLSCPVLSQG